MDIKLSELINNFRHILSQIGCETILYVKSWKNFVCKINIFDRFCSHNQVLGYPLQGRRKVWKSGGVAEGGQTQEIS